MYVEMFVSNEVGHRLTFGTNIYKIEQRHVFDVPSVPLAWKAVVLWDSNI